jgi:predicted O-methyltransferase YrrM/glycosyltransferase involved in cell wall biosynthesis
LIPERINGWGSIKTNVDYDVLYESHSLDKYDFVIFNPKYNHLNKYNDPDFNGTKFNSQIPCDYMLRLKKFRHEILDFSKYDAVYHLFLHLHVIFNKRVSYPQSKQYVHLYPGGGLDNVNSLSNLHSESKLISSGCFITEFIKVKGLKNKYVEAFGGPFVEKNQQPILKIKNENTLNICFTTMGNYIHKGGKSYQEVINKYLNKYPNDNTKFHHAGVNHPFVNSTYLGMLSQKDLDTVYSDKIDILFNLETGGSLNGFPLGVEGMIMGTILFTTDFHNGNVKNNFNFGKELRIVDPANIDNIVDRLKELYEDRDMLLKDSHKLQMKAFDLFSHENVMGRIFNFIEDNLTPKTGNMNFRDNSNPGYPEGSLFGLTYSFRDDKVLAQCLPYTLDFIRSYVEKISNGIIVEIGVLGGATLLNLYEVCNQNKNKIYGVDPFDKITIFNGQTEEEINNNMKDEARKLFKSNREKLDSIITKYQLNDVITVINETSENAVSQFEDNSIDVLHIDGDHSTNGVYNDFAKYWPKMKKGTGVIIGDDFEWTSVKDGIDRFCRKYNVKCEPVLGGLKCIIIA